MISNVPDSISPRVQSIGMGCAEPKESAKLRIPKISGCASGLSLPDNPTRDRSHPYKHLILRAPEEPAALLSTGRNLGLQQVLDFPHKPIFLLLKTFTSYFLIFILFKPQTFQFCNSLSHISVVYANSTFASHSLIFFI